MVAESPTLGAEPITAIGEAKGTLTPVGLRCWSGWSTCGKTMPSSPSAQSSATPHDTPAALTATSNSRAPRIV